MITSVNRLLRLRYAFGSIESNGSVRGYLKALLRRILVSIVLIAPAFASEPQGYFGAQLAPIEGKDGAVVVSILPGSPAEAAGFAAEDEIVKLGAESIVDQEQLAEMLRGLGAGNSAVVEFVRDGKPLTATLTLGTNPWQDADQPDTSTGLYPVVVHTDIAYVDGALDKQKLDLYLPESDTPVPAMLWIHGGGWSFGDRAGERALALRFAERGIAVAAMSYRASAGFWANEKESKTGVTHPAHINDVADAFAWLHSKADTYGFAQFYVSGHSSGGHLAALLSTDKRYLETRGLALRDVDGALPIGGTYDIPHYYEALTSSEDAERGRKHIHAVFTDKESAWVDASPVSFLADSTVPMLVVVEEQAGFQRYAGQLEDAAKRIGRDDIFFLPAAGRNHNTVILLMRGRAPDEIRAKMIEFMAG